MARPKRLEWFEREAIAAWHAAGHSLTEISTGVGVSHETARQVIVGYLCRHLPTPAQQPKEQRHAA